MNLLQSILDKNNNGQIDMLSRQFGVTPQQTGSIAQALLPILAQGFNQQIRSSNGLDSLLSLLKSKEQNTLSQPISNSPEAVESGNSILGQIFGSKNVSRNIAQRAAEHTGVDSSVIKKMRPVLALAAVSHLAKRTSKVESSNQPSMLNQLSQFIGQNETTHSPLGNLMEILRDRAPAS